MSVGHNMKIIISSKSKYLIKVKAVCIIQVSWSKYSSSSGNDLLKGQDILFLSWSANDVIVCLASMFSFDYDSTTIY